MKFQSYWFWDFHIITNKLEKGVESPPYTSTTLTTWSLRMIENNNLDVGNVSKPTAGEVFFLDAAKTRKEIRKLG